MPWPTFFAKLYGQKDIQMKKIWIIIALAGFTATGSYAQHKDCTCKDKERKAASTKVQQPLIVPRVPAKDQDQVCLMPRKDLRGITHCDEMKYESTSIYLGNYPQKANVKTTQPAKQATATPAVKKTSNRVAVNHTVNDAPGGIKAAPTADEEAFFHYTPPGNAPMKPCYTYTQNDIIVRECHDHFYDNRKTPLLVAPVMEYSTEKTYMGFYPDNSKNWDPRAMENRNVGPIPGIGDL
jgi:hypothetical protein